MLAHGAKPCSKMTAQTTACTMHFTTLQDLRALYGPARERSVKKQMPSMSEMLKDQIGGDMPVESQAQMLARYALDL